MEWKLPPNIKIYEAIGCLGDGRIEQKENTAIVYSSSLGKSYTVTYDSTNESIIANDNGSYWQGYLGYPSIAFLMYIGKLKRYPDYEVLLKGIYWKDINTKYKNDFSKTENYIHTLIRNSGRSLEDFLKDMKDILKRIESFHLKHLGKKVKPPQGY